jgi:RNA polymerase sigma-70 factor (ECF subfamily)
MRDVSSTEQLFWRIAADDEDAFQMLFLDFFSPLCVFAYRYVGYWDVCEDIVQETFYKIWKNRKQININTSSRNFLLTSVKNSCIDYLRKKDLEQQWMEKEAQSGVLYAQGDLYSHTELERMLSAALAKLPDTVRQIFEMNRFEEKTYKEIAEEKNISIKTVEARMTKALKILRVELKDYLPLILLFLWQ